MKCAKMIDLGGHSVPCGQCMPCRINRQRLWVGKILLEAKYEQNPSSFVTLTYSDDRIPPGHTLRPDHLSGYINRIRHRSGIGSVRYFACGEYGDKTERPHYHLLLFGVPPESFEQPIRDCWGDAGFVHVGQLEEGSARYVTGYCLKKMGSGSDNDERLAGRYPEFTRASKRPPLGAAGYRHILDLLRSTPGGKAGLKAKGDAPSEIRIGGKVYPVGMYWRQWLRDRLGIEGNPSIKSNWEIDYEKEVKAREQATKVHAKLWHRHKSPTKPRRL